MLFFFIFLCFFFARYVCFLFFCNISTMLRGTFEISKINFQTKNAKSKIFFFFTFFKIYSISGGSGFFYRNSTVIVTFCVFQKPHFFKTYVVLNIKEICFQICQKTFAHEFAYFCLKLLIFVTPVFRQVARYVYFLHIFSYKYWYPKKTSFF